MLLCSAALAQSFTPLASGRFKAPPSFLAHFARQSRRRRALRLAGPGLGWSGHGWLVHPLIYRLGVDHGERGWPGFYEHELAAIGRGDRLRERQPESGAARPADAALEDPVHQVGRHSLALVFHLDHDGPWGV